MFIIALVILVIIVMNLHKVPVWQRGIGGQKLFGQCPFERTTFQKGAFLIILVIIVTNLHKVQRHKGRRSTQLFSSLSLSIPLDRPEKNKIFHLFFPCFSSSSRSAWTNFEKKSKVNSFSWPMIILTKKQIVSDKRNFLRQIHSFQLSWLLFGCKKLRLKRRENLFHVWKNVLWINTYCSKRP